ncbi:uncharacterized protein PHACADRAFT_257386 [Phanerochaete carnosa HHB-10118-sp]|uniref:Uncharacterized protein n=1 Tax=Phanerochaete carnosa (strain HHB-10118-sp) TaxID=650164 RepID=K5W4N4_PHACS|nr:uncharacterized protein PHACADRAFT_257386 [Phanerochaete carnosa HHB-10118-sp]EKM53899.1 hypothetical protein PHACADRAFT_257386 [Phanerochaete carnosa HHB-10118-sp]
MKLKASLLTPPVATRGAGSAELDTTAQRGCTAPVHSGVSVALVLFAGDIATCRSPCGLTTVDCPFNIEPDSDSVVCATVGALGRHVIGHERAEAAVGRL